MMMLRHDQTVDISIIIIVTVGSSGDVAAVVGDLLVVVEGVCGSGSGRRVEGGGRFGVVLSESGGRAGTLNVVAGAWIRVDVVVQDHTLLRNVVIVGGGHHRHYCSQIVIASVTLITVLGLRYKRLPSLVAFVGGNIKYIYIYWV